MGQIRPKPGVRIHPGLCHDRDRLRAALPCTLWQAKAQLRGVGGGSRGSTGGMPEQPTMAAPGYRWVLVREGDPVPRSAPPQTGGEAQTPPPPQPRRESGGSEGGQAGGEGAAAADNGVHGGDGERGGNTGTSLASSLLSGFGGGGGDHTDDGGHGGGSSSGGGGPGGGSMQRSTSASAGPLLAADAEVLRMELRRRATELSALESRVHELELTRDRWVASRACMSLS
eukprot:352590-Chlamydomonas_euryale.AAC.2